MKALAIVIVAAACTSATSSSAFSQDAQLAIRNVSVIPMDAERVLANQTVLIGGGRIVAVGSAGSVDIPDGATIIDGSGRYLMPGLAEMHGHLPSSQWSEAMVDRLLFLNVANGVTTVRGMQGNDAQLRIRSEIESGQRIGPRLILGSPALTGNSASSPAVGASLVRQYKNAGYDLLKVHEGLSPATYDSIAIAAREVGIPFGGHIADAVGLAHAVDMGIGTVEHLDGFIEQLQPNGAGSGPAGFFGLNWARTTDRAQIATLVSQLADADVWVTPTQSLFVNFLSEVPPDQIAADPVHGMSYWPAQTISQWIGTVTNFRANLNRADAEAMLQVRSETLAAIENNGGRILLGADSPQIFNVPGFATVYEAQVMVEAGLTPYQVLRAGTVNPAVYLGEDDFGTVQVGNRADLILLEDNPLEDITALRRRAGVVVNGMWLSAGQIEKRMAALKIED